MGEFLKGAVSGSSGVDGDESELVAVGWTEGFLMWREIIWVSSSGPSVGSEFAFPVLKLGPLLRLFLASSTRAFDRDRFACCVLFDDAGEAT